MRELLEDLTGDKTRSDSAVEGIQLQMRDTTSDGRNKRDVAILTRQERERQEQRTREQHRRVVDFREQKRRSVARARASSKRM